MFFLFDLIRLSFFFTIHWFVGPSIYSFIHLQFDLSAYLSIISFLCPSSHTLWPFIQPCSVLSVHSTTNLFIVLLVHPSIHHSQEFWVAVTQCCIKYGPTKVRVIFKIIFKLQFFSLSSWVCPYLMQCYFMTTQHF